MNVTVFKEAQQAYASGDYKRALKGFTVCAREVDDLSAAELSKFYHLIGNCYVKGGDAKSAAEYYTKALSGSPEKRKPSLYVNLGTALLGTKEYADALDAFNRALDYPVYTTPYKAYSGIGAAQLKLGNITEAGAAYREAALDPSNPAPSKALVNLGVCFMELGRAEDAITSYETALEFDMDDASASKAQANLGQAYLAAGRVQRALDAFEAALEDGNYTLPPLARHDYEIACSLKDTLDARMPGVLDTGFIPTVAPAPAEKPLPSEPVEMPLSESGHFPAYGEPGFDPFAPQTPDLRDEPAETKATAAEEDVSDEPVDAAEEEQPADEEQPAVESDEAQAGAADEGEAVVEEPVEESEHAASDEPHVETAEFKATLRELGISTGDTGKVELEEGGEEADSAQPAEKTISFASLRPDDTLFFNIPKGEGDISEEAAYGTDEFASPFAGPSEEEAEIDRLLDETIKGQVSTEPVADSGEPLNDETAETHMPSPEDTAFFDVTEKDINQTARADIRRKRRARGAGLKAAIVIVVLCIILAAAAGALYVLGFGFPQQEDVARSFINTVQEGGDTSEFWANDVDESARLAQTAPLEGMKAYTIEGVERSMSHTEVYVKGTLEEGGQIDYQVVMSRDGISWAIEYVELYFPSKP